MGMSQNGKSPLAGNGLRLSAQETQVLQYLMGNRNRAVSTRQLTEHALGGLYDPASRRVDQIVFQLRKKLGPAVIADRRGYGYIFEGERGMEGRGK
jgi:two-component system, OmpR family, response regulator